MNYYAQFLIFRIGLYLVWMSSCLIIPISGFSQMTVVTHPQPTGYTSSQTQFKNVLRIDQIGNKWMGFRDIGLGKYDGSAWLMFDSLNSPLPSNHILSIDFNNNGDVWSGTVYGAAQYNGTSWNVFNTINSGLPANKITAISCANNMTWFGTENGVAGFDGSGWVSFNSFNSGLVNDTIISLKAVPGGAVWVGTLKGLSKYENGNWTTYDSLTSIIPSAIVRDLEYDNYGNIWVASIGGVFAVAQSGQVLNFKGDIYQEEFPAAGDGRAFAKDSNGRIIHRVVAGRTYFFRFDNLSITKFQAPVINYGAMALGYCIAMDDNNILWLTGKRDSPSSTSTFVAIDFNSYQPLSLGFVLDFDNYKHLDINNVKTLMLNRGDMHWDLNNPKYEVPKGSGKHTVFTSALWIGGLDQGGNIHLAAQTYRQSGVDYWPGPIDGISMPFDSASCLHYDRIWKVSKWQVEEFKNKFADGSVMNGSYAVPSTFLTWPARGNNFVTDDKAPFFDFNSDNNYNPYDGDYPLIKGDQMLFWIFNDSLATHSETDGAKLGVEIHASAYAFNCTGIADSNAVLNTTTLYHFKIINRSPDDYNGMYMGLWCDNDLGNSSDDYVGCDTTLAMGYAWNGDNDDEGATGYGLNPPMQNIAVLKGTLADLNDNIDNDLDGIVDEQGERTSMNHFHYYNGMGSIANGTPNGYSDMYNYLRSIWLDNLHVTYGGDGRDPGSPPTNFMFSGLPYGPGWTELSAGNPPEDRRFLLSSGPASLPAGGEMTIDFAYVFTRDSLNPNGLTTSVARNIADVQRVKSWFDNDNFPSCEVYSVGVGEDMNNNLSLEIYPNPAEDIIFLNKNFTENVSLIYQISDLSGRILRKERFNNESISVSEFSPGFYFLTVSDGAQIASGRFVKY